MPGRVYGIAALPRAASRALATSAPQAVVVSPHQLGQATEPSKEDEGHTDWYYVSWGSLFLFLVGGPFYFVYLLKEDDELRIFADEHFPGAVAAVKQLVNVDEVRSDPHYQNIDQFGEGTFSLHAEAPSTHNTSEQNADETLIVPVNGEAQVVTLSSASTAAAAAKSLGISEQDFINTAKISGECQAAVKCWPSASTRQYFAQSLSLTTTSHYLRHYSK